MTADYLVRCDYSGFVCKRSDCIKQWNGLIVRKDFAELERHPQDKIKPIREQPFSGDVRNEQQDPVATTPSITVDQMI